MEYKTCVNKVHGSFNSAGTLSAWASPRNNPLFVKDNYSSVFITNTSLKVDPRILNSIMAVSYDGSEPTDPFICDCHVSVEAVRPMSVSGDDLETFENNFIRGFNLWLDEYETETYWNQVRTNDYVLATIADTTTYSFTLPSTYRTPVFDMDKELKFVVDGTVIARFKMVDPNQRQVDDELDRPNRATFVGRNVVLSRAPTDEEVGAEIILDVVQYFPKLTRTDDTALGLIYSKNLAVLGVAKNNTLADVTKVSLSPSFAQKYNNELNKAILINNSTNEVDTMRRDDFSNIGGIW